MPPLRWPLALLLVLLAAAPVGAQPSSALRHGAITLERDGGMATYTFRVEADSSVRLGDAEGREVVLPAFVLLGVYGQVAASAGLDTTRVDRLSYGVERGRLTFSVTDEVGLTVLAALLIALAVSSGLLSAWLWGRLRRERAQRHQLAESRTRLAESREDERMRLAHDLHDGPVQDLHALRMRLDMAARAGHGPPGPEAAAEVQDEIVRVIRELRAISEDLRPPALSPFGLAAAVRALVDRFRLLNPDTAVDLDLDDDGQALPEIVRIVLFRVCQESLNNAVKHGHPRQIHVCFRLGPQRITFEIRDDAGGFDLPDDLNALALRGHYGLLGMSERVEAIGADLSVESVPGVGTTTRVTAAWHAPVTHGPSASDLGRSHEPYPNDAAHHSGRSGRRPPLYAEGNP